MAGSTSSVLFSQAAIDLVFMGWQLMCAQTCTISGAVNSGVPHIWRRLPEKGVVMPASPKSAILTFIASSIRMFSGFRSLWMTRLQGSKETVSALKSCTQLCTWAAEREPASRDKAGDMDRDAVCTVNCSAPQLNLKLPQVATVDWGSRVHSRPCTQRTGCCSHLRWQ